MSTSLTQTDYLNLYLAHLSNGNCLPSPFPIYTYMYWFVTGLKIVLYIYCQFPHLVNILTKLELSFTFVLDMTCQCFKQFQSLFSSSFFLSMDMPLYS